MRVENLTHEREKKLVLYLQYLRASIEKGSNLHQKIESETDVE